MVEACSPALSPALVRLHPRRVHPYGLRGRQNSAERRNLRGRQDLQPLHRGLPAEAFLGERPVEAEVTGFARQQLGVEILQLRIGAVGGQQRHALMAAGLDQAGHQIAVQHPARFIAPHRPAEAGAVAGRRQRSDGNASLRQQGQHLLEMLELLPCQRAEPLAQAWLGRVAEHQLQGCTGRLAFAVGVVDQDQVGLLDRRLQPLAAGGSRQPFHPGDRVARACGAHGWPGWLLNRPTHGRVSSIRRCRGWSGAVREGCPGNGGAHGVAALRRWLSRPSRARR